jgi:trans-aconitate methyltransferase
MDKLSKHWDNIVTKNHRHYTGHMPAAKIKDHINRFYTHVVKQIPRKNISKALDWGCGGGLFTKEMLTGRGTPICNVVILDILQSSLDEAERYAGKSVEKILYEGQDVTRSDIDLILCYSVIQHFPSYGYWRNIANQWLKIAPRYIAAQIKLADNVIEAANYYHKRNYLNGLKLSRIEIEKTFKQYNIIYWRESKTSASGQPIAFFVLERQ